MGRMFDVPRTAVAFAAANTTKSFTLIGRDANGAPAYNLYRGWARKTIIEAPAWANNDVLEFQVKNPSGKELFSRGNFASNMATPFDDEYEVYEGCTVNLNLYDSNGNAVAPGGSGGSAYVTIIYEEAS